MFSKKGFLSLLCIPFPIPNIQASCNVYKYSFNSSIVAWNQLPVTTYIFPFK